MSCIYRGKLVEWWALFDPVAQSVEHLTFNQVAVGSNPTRITIFSIKTTQNHAEMRGFVFVLIL